MGDKHPIAPQMGEVNIACKIESGSFVDVVNLRLIEEGSPRFRLVEFSKTNKDEVIVTLQTSDVFVNGLEFYLKPMMLSGNYLLGMTKEEMIPPHSLENQRTILELLTRLILPNKVELVLSLARPCLMFKESSELAKSSFRYKGQPMLPESVKAIPRTNGKELFFVGNLSKDMLGFIPALSEVKDNISFYLRVHGCGEGWPQKSNEFKVYNYDEPQEVVSADYEYIQKPKDFIFSQVLDIPQYNDTKLVENQFTDEELEEYMELEEVYKGLIVEDYEMGRDKYAKVFGYPNSLQSCVSYEVAKIKLNSDDLKVISKEAEDWRLLYQIQETDITELADEFGHGWIYFMIHKDDLAIANFNNVQVVVQGT